MVTILTRDSFQDLLSTCMCLTKVKTKINLKNFSDKKCFYSVLKVKEIFLLVDIILIFLVFVTDFLMKHYYVRPNVYEV